ncbi:MAG: hypothetical protein HYU37_12385 [Acidobacteria bacterium]|nr:hypothetical protein [Acidobacteriota bacterium]
MDLQRFVTGTVAGGVTLFVLGYLIFDVAFAGFYAANAGPAIGVVRDGQLLWAVALGTLAYGALIAYVIVTSRAPLTAGAGVVIGATVAFLVWFTVDFILYGISNLATLTRTVVDPLLEAVRGGVAGAVIAAVLRGAPVAAR